MTRRKFIGAALIVAATKRISRPAAAAKAVGASPSSPQSIAKLMPTRSRGREWFSKWANGHARSFVDATDPDDPWFDTRHGNGTYAIDGNGLLAAKGDMVRMYVLDPAKKVEWNENLEITVYIRRIGETKTLSYSGLQIFARTNHGAIGNEEKNLCDDRGYGAKVTVDGRWEFEKEIRHGADAGYSGGESVKPWKELPKDKWIGVKFILRTQTAAKHVRLELYRDLTEGEAGGQWEKIVEDVDSGATWGVAAPSCAPGVVPELALTRQTLLPNSESGKPMLTVYFRHEYGTMQYRNASVREVDPLP
jgi:hypothetical protein